MTSMPLPALQPVAFTSVATTTEAITMAEARSDEELMLAYAGGEAAAFDLLYGRHKGGLYRYMFRQLSNAATTEELFQEIWIKVIQAAPNYQPTAKFSTWLYRIAHNRIIDFYRSQSRRPEWLTDEVPEVATDEDSSVETILDQAFIKEKLLEALTKLPFEQREAFVLREDGGFSVEMIAEITGVNPETAKSRLRYAMRKLKALLAEEVKA